VHCILHAILSNCAANFELCRALLLFLLPGAHKGVGLGRMFLRHLRRTRLLLHVVDGAAADPGTDYLAVREELRLYNPDYVERPHIVAVNKVDLEDAGGAMCCIVGHSFDTPAFCISSFIAAATDSRCFVHAKDLLQLLSLQQLVVCLKCLLLPASALLLPGYVKSTR
jgi:GTPase involved in cell partitioning and DNA repair